MTGDIDDIDDIDDTDQNDGTGDERGGVPVRRGAVDLRTRTGQTVHYDDAVVKYDPDAFVVSPDGDFSGEETRYPKVDLAWIEVRHPRS